MRDWRVSRRNLGWLMAIALAAAISAPATAELERELIPTPPGGGPGVKVFEPIAEGLESQLLASTPVSSRAPRRHRELPATSEGPQMESASKQPSYELIGGDDVLMLTKLDGVTGGYTWTAYDSDGRAYLAQWLNDPVTGYEIYVMRSTDDGCSWSQWGSLSPADPGARYGSLHMIIAEGVQDRCFLAYSMVPSTGNATIRVTYADISGASAVFTELLAVESPGESVYRPRLATDAANFSSYYLYLVAWSGEGGHEKIWFARSVNQGTSWESEYTVAEMPLTDRQYVDPYIAYGFGNRIHLVWEYASLDGSFDSAIQYRRADNWANGGLSAWSGVQSLSSPSDGFDSLDPKVAASTGGDDVLVAARYYASGMGSHVEVISSADQGDSWSIRGEVSDLMDVRGLVWQPSTDSWILNSYGYGTRIRRASTSKPWAWSDIQIFSDGAKPGLTGGNCYPVALNPEQGDRIGAFWAYYYGTAGGEYLHDAEWFGDPGWPDEEPDSPIELLHPPKTAPALVDLDGDDDLEIVFSDDIDRIVAVHHDGVPVAGWPVTPGSGLSSSPVAIGDLEGDGIPEVVVGTAGGGVYAYDGNGALKDGWPVATLQRREVHVSIGALGPPYARLVVACAGNYAQTFNYRGEVPAGFASPPAPVDLEHPAAIGDVDGDGRNELVIAGEGWIAAYHPTEPLAEFSRTLTDWIADAPSLGDLDSDGDVEILAPTIDGKMYALDGDGADLSGWPFDTGAGYDPSSAALANCLGTGEPEVAFATVGYKVHLLRADGTKATGYPKTTTNGWWILGSPIIGGVDGASADIIVGSREQLVWSWDNFGNLIPGWPRATSDDVDKTTAMGDIDLDGNVELVVLDESQIMIFDLNRGELPAANRWPMQGHDPQRTACWECPEDIATAVGDDPAALGITRVSFALNSANPASGRALFQFALPEPAAVSLDLFDVRGRHVRTVIRTEAPVGTHQISWDGRDADGQPVASGQYLAHLRVRGPRVDESMVRKLTWLR